MLSRQQSRVVKSSSQNVEGSGFVLCRPLFQTDADWFEIDNILKGTERKQIYLDTGDLRHPRGLSTSMNNREKILKSIKRLEDRKPSKWDVALILQIKQFLFPLIREELKDSYEKAKDLF